MTPRVVITPQRLRDLGAYGDLLVRFAAAWPDGLALSAPSRLAYERATTPIRRACAEATATAQRAYDESTATAQRIYEERTAPALYARAEAMAMASRARDEATATALRACDEAVIVELIRLLLAEPAPATNAPKDAPHP